MAQLASNIIPPKGLGTINWQDLWKTVFLSAVVNVLLGLYTIINAGEWPTHADFIVMLKATIAIIIGNMIKVVSTNNVGELFKKDKPVVAVPTEELIQLKEQAKTIPQ